MEPINTASIALAYLSAQNLIIDLQLLVYSTALLDHYSLINLQEHVFLHAHKDTSKIQQPQNASHNAPSLLSDIMQSLYLALETVLQIVLIIHMLIIKSDHALLNAQ